ncbi:putative enzyme related to lactoylglutathione lyase [Paucibacter oligotrophus]|uniref:Putative enzyme related to lactoylglutathione lyase n=1 Tax=Roseateles oligotrophus TaxID=1769250 RepID=A0A840L711_9BURK|nr:VOC family protein [Roseateles oligotrophus]MBB4842435.1 putative enzyme related to lactoylglutathione lyase [Roseateles oligotrophus]
MHNNLVWVDIPVVDLDRAIAFYAAVLGRPVSKQGGPGFSFGLFTHEGEEVGGCLAQMPDNAPATQGPLIYLNASGRIKAAVQAAVDHGGRVLNELHQIGPHGFRVVLLDSEGNRIALHSHIA